jgi:phenylpyruvate tautomerase PptA (4-oxalocrotonate tautomerase family)
MPFLRIDAFGGRNREQVKDILDAVHRAIVSAFEVPLRDRYQVYEEHSESNFIVEDTGLGITRTRNVIVISITTRPRTEEQKKALYANLCGELKQSCGIEPTDIVVSVVTNTDSDWSFGNGRAQFLTGEL